MKKIDEIRLMLKNGFEPDYKGWGWEYVNDVQFYNDLQKQLPLGNCLKYKLKEDYSEKNKAIVIVGVTIRNKFSNYEIFIIDTLDFENFNLQRYPFRLKDSETPVITTEPSTVVTTTEPSTVVTTTEPSISDSEFKRVLANNQLDFNVVKNEFLFLISLLVLLSISSFGLSLWRFLH